MSLFGASEDCPNAGCGHPMSDHVNDRIMRRHEWVTVHRCVACETGGGSCTDGKSIISAIVPEADAEATGA